MTADELPRIAEIDRSEHIARQYVYRDGALELRDVEITAAPWSDRVDDAHGVPAIVEAWRPMLAAEAAMLGAFDGPRLVGVALYRRRIAEDTAQLAALYVSAGHRRRGIGAALTDLVIDRARADGAARLYVSATPTAGTVDFYRALGFELARPPLEALLRLEPDDIHLVRAL